MKEPDPQHRGKGHDDCGHEPSCFTHRTPKGRCNCYCDPSACAVCGRREEGHGMKQQPGYGLHRYVRPAMLQRMNRSLKLRRYRMLNREGEGS